MKKSSLKKMDSAEVLKRTFRRLVIAGHDFEEARDYLSHFDSTLPVRLQEAIATAAIIAYGRPFKWSHPGDDDQADTKIEFSLDELFEEQELSQHKIIIDTRDRGVAHSDYELKPSDRLPSPEGGALSSSKIYSPLTDLNIALFKDMAHKLWVHAHTMIILTNREIQSILGPDN